MSPSFVDVLLWANYMINSFVYNPLKEKQRYLLQFYALLSKE